MRGSGTKVWEDVLGVPVVGSVRYLTFCLYIPEDDRRETIHVYGCYREAAANSTVPLAVLHVRCDWVAWGGAILIDWRPCSM